MIELLEYLDERERSAFGIWRANLDPLARAKTSIALTRVAAGNISSVKGVGSGVSEVKINFGPGYRVYFGRDGETIIIILGGGTKKRQQSDIENAHERWADYRRRKKREE